VVVGQDLTRGKSLKFEHEIRSNGLDVVRERTSERTHVPATHFCDEEAGVQGQKRTELLKTLSRAD